MTDHLIHTMQLTRYRSTLYILYQRLRDIRSDVLYYSQWRRNVIYQHSW